MKCISCEIEINPKWAHAIDVNICPFCGQHIMEEHLKNLFGSLRQTMESLVAYPEALNDWMLSNYSYIKTDSEDIIKYVPKDLIKNSHYHAASDRKDSQKFTVKVATEQGEEEVMVEKIQPEEKTNDFFKRAEVIKHNVLPAEKTQHLKALAQQIKKAGSQGLTTSNHNMVLSPELMENADPEAIAEYQQLVSNNMIGSAINSNDLDSDDLPGGDFILQANLMAAASKNGNNRDGANAKDLAALQKMQAGLSESRKNLLTGAKGSFRR